MSTYSEMESCGILNPSLDLDIYCLHVTCFRILSLTVEEFRNGWNEHLLSTEKNKTPRQLFVSGLLALKNDGNYHEELCQVNDFYLPFVLLTEIDFIFPFKDKNEINFAAKEAAILGNLSYQRRRPEAVNVSPINSPLSPNEEFQLKNHFDDNLVNLQNIKESYIFVKSCVNSLINRRVV